ncbi:hypothetical protein BDN70DRAFT_936702 [Pholiota conissans]|uniref:Uncharacterized protein n=1 Tax=Pholiota conissans TaxID=109636 RepID=A0A9P5YUY8_9AGAR|nr:hypothetical protein BDN70DRAFT_936702 [Pholiota conissans]
MVRNKKVTPKKSPLPSSSPPPPYITSAGKAKWAARKAHNQSSPLSKKTLIWPSPLGPQTLIRKGKQPQRKSSERAALQVKLAYQPGGSLDSQTDSQTAIDNLSTASLTFSAPSVDTTIPRSGSTRAVSTIAPGLVLQTFEPASQLSAIASAIASGPSTKNPNAPSSESLLKSLQDVLAGLETERNTYLREIQELKKEIERRDDIRKQERRDSRQLHDDLSEISKLLGAVRDKLTKLACNIEYH